MGKRTICNRTRSIGMSSARRCVTRHRCAKRWKPAPGNHAGTYFTEGLIVSTLSQHAASLTSRYHINHEPARDARLIEVREHLLRERDIVALAAVHIDPVHRLQDRLAEVEAHRAV
jgi:hypothetical protein